MPVPGFHALDEQRDEDELATATPEAIQSIAQPDNHAVPVQKGPDISPELGALGFDLFAGH